MEQLSRVAAPKTLRTLSAAPSPSVVPAVLAIAAGVVTVTATRYPTPARVLVGSSAVSPRYVNYLNTFFLIPEVSLSLDG